MPFETYMLNVIIYYIPFWGKIWALCPIHAIRPPLTPVCIRYDKLNGTEHMHEQKFISTSQNEAFMTNVRLSFQIKQSLLSKSLY